MRPVKNAVAIVICLCLLMQCMARYVVTGVFNLNKDYIARNLCENRAKPQLNCCGKCYLRKQLRKADDNQSPSRNAPPKAEKSLVAFLLPAPLKLNPRYPWVCEEPARTPGLQHLRHCAIPFPFFHPPSVAC